MVGGIVLIDVALLTAWEVADPLEWEQFNFTEEVRKIKKTLRKINEMKFSPTFLF